MSSRLQDELIDLAEAFDNASVTGRRIAIYIEDLEDLPEDAVIAAIRRLRKTHKYFPTNSEIREAAVAQQPLDGLADMAWTEVIQQASSVGYNVLPRVVGGEWLPPLQPTFSSEITAQTVKSVGWKSICHTPSGDDLTMLRNQFIKTWNAYASRTLKQAQNNETPDLMLASPDRKAIEQ